MMEIKTWKDVEGKWNDEPSLLELEGKGYHMMVFRHPEMGNLNGYVGVNINNPLFLVDYDHRKVDDVHVHGGLSFASLGVNVGYSPFKDSYWYFGFDTAHAFDLVPTMVAMRQSIPQLGEFDESQIFFKDTYRDFNYVSEQVNQLIEQLRGIVKELPKQAVNHKKIYRKLHKMKKVMRQ